MKNGKLEKKDKKAKLKRKADEAKLGLSHQIDSFIEKIERGTENTDSFLSLEDIEKEWTVLRSQTDRIYDELVSFCLGEIDERNLIKSKKENTRKRG